LWSSSKRDWPRAFLAKRPDQRHEFLGPFRVTFGIGLQIFQADWRFEDKAGRKSHPIRFSFRVVGSPWHLDFSLAHQTVWVTRTFYGPVSAGKGAPAFPGLRRDPYLDVLRSSPAVAIARRVNPAC
jgi:hypothetical protein